MKIILSEVEFPSLKEVRVKASTILDMHPPGYCLQGNDFNFVMGLLQNHPNYESKSGSGVDEIYIGSGPFNSKCFHIKRIDGTITDFSYRKCCFTDKSIGINHKRDVLQAFRTSIQPDISFFLRGKSGLIAHHKEPTFMQLVKDFMEANKLTYDSIEIGGHGDLETQRFLKDNCLSDSFRNYHWLNANLVSVTPEEHYNIHFGK